jgi:polar amino acid transport system substrate-binding protein
MKLRPSFFRSTSLRVGLLMLALGALGLLGSTAAWAQVTSDKPTSAWSDAQVAPRPPMVDTVVPILRPPTVDTLATLRQRGVLRVGVVQVAPMVMQDRSGTHVGFSVDLARRLAADLGVGVEFVETSWSDVMPQLLDGRSDAIITGLWMNVPRALVANFTQPTASEGIYLIGSRPRAAQRRSLDAFNQPGVRIAVAKDPVQMAAAKARFPRATLDFVEDDPLLVVSEGGAHAAVVATLSPDAVVATAPQRWFLPSAEPLARTSVAMAVRKGDPDFLAFLNSWLDMQRENGWLAERTRYWATSTDGFR